MEVQVAEPEWRARHSRSAPESTIEAGLTNGHSLMAWPEFDAGHLRPCLELGTPSFGKIGATTVAPRTIRFALKYSV
jgi:hypothetical protein